MMHTCASGTQTKTVSVIGLLNAKCISKQDYQHFVISFM